MGGVSGPGFSGIKGKLEQVRTEEASTRHRLPMSPRPSSRSLSSIEVTGVALDQRPCRTLTGSSCAGPGASGASPVQLTLTVPRRFPRSCRVAASPCLAFRVMLLRIPSVGAERPRGSLLGLGGLHGHRIVILRRCPGRANASRMSTDSNWRWTTVSWKLPESSRGRGIRKACISEPPSADRDCCLTRECVAFHTWCRTHGVRVEV